MPAKKRARSSAVDDRLEFQRKYQDAISISGLSSQTLSKVLETLDFTATRYEQVKIRDSRFDACVVSEEFPLIDGGTFTLEYLEPSLMMQQVFDECPHVAAQYASALVSTQCSQAKRWNLIIGYDEFVPGDKLALKNQRKLMVISFAFVELGRALLCKDAVWFTPLCVRTSMLSRIEGGWGHVLKRFLYRILLGSMGLATVGVPIVSGGAVHLLYGRLRFLVADAVGHQAGLDWRGHASIRPCFKHSNVFSKSCDMVGRIANCVDVTCEDATKFIACKAADVYFNADLMVEAEQQYDRGEMAPGRFAALEKACPQKANRHGVLHDKLLREEVDFVEVMWLDWLHCLLADGVMSVEAYLFIATYTTQVAVRNFLSSDWIFPKAAQAKCKKLKRSFDEWHCNKNDEKGKVRCQASELLSLYTLIRAHADANLPRADGQPARESFEALCTVIDIIKYAKRGYISTQAAGQRMRQAVGRFMLMHKRAHGEEHITPKFHWLFDIADQLEASPADYVVDMFIIERLHLRIKSEANNVKNTSRFERSVLAATFNSQANRLRCREDIDGLRGKSASWPGTGVIIYPPTKMT